MIWRIDDIYIGVMENGINRNNKIVDYGSYNLNAELMAKYL